MPRRGLVVLLGALGWALAGCAQSPGDGGAVGGPGLVPGVAQDATPQGPATGPAARTVPHRLYTHCGIHELRFEGRYYERVGGPATDGSGNPPRGWDNPEQSGFLTVSGDSAVFTDDRGHREHFELREGATDFLQLCA